MPITNDFCTVPTCSNYKIRYCLLHKKGGASIETIKPLAKIQKTAEGKKEALKTYLKEAKIFITLHPKCKVRGCKNKATQVHHQKGREGDLLLDKKFWMHVCAEHHQRITYDPAWAIANGYSLSRLEKEKA